ncbi:hypothetical protein FRC03_010108 [Tulasnella sp. 419]|nr:hypothetical protein FRC03_010108 [Tulasnella sp. 419]
MMTSSYHQPTTSQSRKLRITGPQDLESYRRSLHEYTQQLWQAARENAEREAKHRAERKGRRSTEPSKHR